MLRIYAQRDAQGCVPYMFPGTYVKCVGDAALRVPLLNNQQPSVLRPTPFELKGALSLRDSFPLRYALSPFETEGGLVTPSRKCSACITPTRANAPHASSPAAAGAPSPEGAQEIVAASFLREFPALLPGKELSALG